MPRYFSGSNVAILRASHSSIAWPLSFAWRSLLPHHPSHIMATRFQNRPPTPYSTVGVPQVSTKHRFKLGWPLQLTLKPPVCRRRSHRIDLFDHSLMDAIARRAFERPNLEAQAAGGDAGQLGFCLARGAKWSVNNHDASPWIGRERYRTLSHR
jgi:hypothetical protein